MKIIREIFAGSNSKLSSMRVMAFLCLLQAFFYLDWQILRDKPVDVATLTVLLTVAIGGKVSQKIFEGKPAGGAE